MIFSAYFNLELDHLYPPLPHYWQSWHFNQNYKNKTKNPSPNTITLTCQTCTAYCWFSKITPCHYMSVRHVNHEQCCTWANHMPFPLNSHVSCWNVSVWRDALIYECSESQTLWTRPGPVSWNHTGSPSIHAGYTPASTTLSVMERCLLQKQTDQQSWSEMNRWDVVAPKLTHLRKINTFFYIFVF